MKRNKMTFGTIGLVMVMALICGQLVYAQATKTESTGPTVAPVVTYKKVSGGGIAAEGSYSAWSSARTNIVANDTATTYGTNDTGNFSVSGFQHYRVVISAHLATDAFNVQCGSCTPGTIDDYVFSDKIPLVGRGAHEPYMIECETNGMSFGFVKYTNLSSGANITATVVQNFN